jgi:HAD superfamily phosphoserine phosphatase-like hydrolase
LTRFCDLVCFDLDGTLIQGTVFIWQTLHDAFGTDGARRRQAREDFHAGRITYQQWFDHDLVLLGEAAATREGIEAALEGIHPTPGARETLAALQAADVRLAIVSGSIDLVLARFFGDVAFDEVLINRLSFDETGRLTGGAPTDFDVERKGAGVREIARRLGVDLARTAFVGDNYNDVSAARTAGLSIAFNPRSAELAEAAGVVVRDTDLRSILGHLL